ncbi:PadR family transcriptional regulator [Nonomuraea sp. NPDC005650]|uniref:PadR family transcriptional regulator n=1 Tax=Nonomuraea sp. NPDC005650 TaxID=3157045 RepID=UPI00339EB3C2
MVMMPKRHRSGPRREPGLALVWRQATAVLEGIVLAILSGRPAYGYEITAWLREQGFTDIAEGTIYALLVRVEQRGLVDVEKVPSEKGPPRKVYSLNAQGRAYLEEFWRTWSFLTERLEQLREGGK